MIDTSENPTVRPSEVVHHLVYGWDGAPGFQLLCAVPHVVGGASGFQLSCDTSWVVATLTYRARVMTEMDPVSRMIALALTTDPVDCMKCLVRYGQRS